MRPAALRAKSASTICKIGTRSAGPWPNIAPPSARASCISFSARRARRLSSPSTVTARWRRGPSGLSAIKRWVCAKVAAMGVRNSCAALAAKARSASKVRLRRAIRRLAECWMGSNSLRRKGSFRGVKSSAPFTRKATDRCTKGRKARVTHSATPNRVSGNRTPKGTSIASTVSRSASWRWVKGSATWIVYCPDTAERLNTR